MLVPITCRSSCIAPMDSLGPTVRLNDLPALAVQLFLPQ